MAHRYFSVISALAWLRERYVVYMRLTADWVLVGEEIHYGGVLITLPALTMRVSP